MNTTINWQRLHELPLDKHHLYNSLDGDGLVANHEGFEVFIYINIAGKYQFRGGYKSHLNLTVQRDGFHTASHAQAAANKWLREKAEASAKRRARREAKIAGGQK